MAENLQQRRRRFAITSGGGLLLTLVALVLLNVLANWFYVRVDLTRQNAYSLSKSSKKLARDLDDRVVVKAFFSPDLPSPYNSYARYVRDLLAEYKSASRGKMAYEFVLTSPPQDFEQKAREAQLIPVQFQQAGNDQLQIKRGYMGIVLYYHDKTERIPIVKGVENLEYALTSKLARMVRKQKKTVAFSSGHGEVQWRTPQSPLAQDLEELYTLTDQPLTGGATMPFQADALFVVGPKQKFDDKALYQLDQALMQGIPTAFFVDAKNVQVQRFMAMPNDSGLAPLLEHYGISLGNRLVLDQQCESVTMTQNLGGFAFNTNMPYPYIVAVSNFASNDPITRDLTTVGLPFTSTIESKAGNGVQFTSLLYSSPRSWLSPPENYRISPDAITPPHSDEPHGPYILGGMLSGRFTSFFQGKPSPAPGAAPIAQSPPTQILVIATSQIFSPEMPPFPGAQALLTNAMAVLSHDETLVGIHGKEQIFRPLKPIAGSLKGAVQIGCTLGVAFLAAALGIYRWRRRQSWREWIGAGFKGA